MRNAAELQEADAAMNEQERQLNAVLASLLASTIVAKLGFSLETDIRRLCSSYPHMPCFQTVRARGA